MENGYSLTELPPAVRQIEGEDGPVYIEFIDGRTRLEILDSHAEFLMPVVDIFTMDEELILFEQGKYIIGIVNLMARDLLVILNIPLRSLINW